MVSFLCLEETGVMTFAEFLLESGVFCLKNKTNGSLLLIYMPSNF